jgi:hypothetical protein
MALLTGLDPTKLKELGASVYARFVADRPRSLALTQEALRLMPRGVPMSWMDDLYEHPPMWVSHGSGSSFMEQSWITMSSKSGNRFPR